MLTDKNNEVMAKILEALNNNKKSEDLINHINARINDIKDEELKLKESMKILEELKQNQLHQM